MDKRTSKHEIDNVAIDAVFDDVYATTINNLNIKDIQVNADTLFEDVSDGYVLLKILETIKNSAVNHKQMHKNPSIFKRKENVN